MPTVSMPSATVPMGKPAPAASKAATKQPAPGFIKPAGLSRQTVSNKVEDEEEVETGPQPVQLGISIAATLVALLFAYTAYSADHTPNRVSDYLFPEPQAAEGSGNDGGEFSTSSDDEETSADSSGEEEEEGESSDEEEEEEE